MEGRLILIELIKLNESSLAYYRNNVNRNKKSSLDTIRRKMTRNKKLALIYKISKGKTWYTYGNLRFTVKDNVIDWIENGHSAHPKWSKDMDKYREISENLGLKITDYREQDQINYK